MLPGLTRIPTKDMSREDWLEHRRKSLGGSDAAGVVGLSQWASPYSLWAEKTGRVPEKEDTEAMRQGRDLEDYVAQRWEEATGGRVRRLPAILYNPQYPFAHANIDRLVLGDDAGLECKTTNTLNVKQFHGIDFPEQYYAQCVHYLAVTGAKRWHLAVLVFGRGFFTFTLERDEAEIAALMEAEAAFWQMVEEDTPPPIDGSDASTSALQTVFAESNGSTMALFGRDTALIEYMSLKAQREELDSRITEIENAIKCDMGAAEKATCGTFNVSWKSQTRQTFQAKAFASDYPDIDLAPYYKTTSLRPFKVTEKALKEAV